jgi:hypothetical protein
MGWPATFAVTILATVYFGSISLAQQSVTAKEVTYDDAVLIKEYPQSVYISHAAGKTFIKKADLSAKDSSALGIGEAATDQSLASPGESPEVRQESESKALSPPPATEAQQSSSDESDPKTAGINASSQQAEDLPPEVLDAMVVISGKEGSGSGFICSFKGKNYIVTNQHVISGLTGARFQTRGGFRLQPTVWEVATDVDLVLMEVRDFPPSIEPLHLLDDLSKQVSQGDTVTIPGNSEGHGVVTQTHGQLLAIGGQRVETDCPVYPGNSGSPIIHRKTGKVIGVLTEAELLILDEFTKHSFKDKKSAIKSEIRYFGYRMDTAADWRPISPSALNSERVVLEASRRELRWIADYFTGSSDAYKEYKELHVARNEAFQAYNRRDLALSEVVKARQRFLWRLEGMINRAVQRIPKHKLVYIHQEKAQAVRRLADSLRTGVEIVGRDDELTVELIKRGR